MKNIARAIAAAVAVSGLSLCAQGEDGMSAEVPVGAEQAADAGGGSAVEAGGQLHNSNAEAKFFYTLPKVQKLEGAADVFKPGASDWEAVVEGRHYPLGSSFRTTGASSRLSVAFGRECSVMVSGESSFGTRGQGLGEKSRAITLKSGMIALRLPRSLPEGLFSVEAPGFSVVNPAGNSTYRYEKTGDGDVATIRCVTGSLAVFGRHFRIISMRAANEVRIRTSQDALFTGIYGTRGDYMCKLDQGLVKVNDVETGESHVEEKFLEWKMSPKTAVRIQRAVPSIGSNMSVTVMTFDAAGNLKNRCAFAENRFEVNSGELAPHDKVGQSELAKKAAEAASGSAHLEAETVDVDAGSDSNGSSDDLDF